MPMVISLLKWPVAVVVALLTPAAVAATWRLLNAAWDVDLWRSPFALGFAGAAIALRVVQRSPFVRLWATIDHEVAHAVFAWVTFVPVREISATDGSTAHVNGGRAGHVALGGDNWLISIAPYFFPTAAVAVLVLVWALAARPTELASVLLGATVAWSIISRWNDTHLGQSDLQAVGVGFSFLILPGANLLCYGALLANELGGPQRTLAFLASTYTITLGWLNGWMP